MILNHGKHQIICSAVTLKIPQYVLLTLLSLFCVSVATVYLSLNWPFQYQTQREVTFQSMFMYSDYILQHTQAQIFWRLVHGKVATLKVIMRHHSGSGRTGFPGASGSITQLSFCEQTNSGFTLMCRFVRMFMKTVPILWGWRSLLIYYQYLSSVISFHLHFSQIDLICDSSEMHRVVIMSCKTSVL